MNWSSRTQQLATALLIASLMGYGSAAIFGFFKNPSRQISSERNPASDRPAGYIDLIVNPPQVRIDWSTPRSLFKTEARAVIKREVGKRIRGHKGISAQGHSMVHINCNDGSRKIDEFSGFSGDNRGEGGKNIMRGAGFGALLEQYDDGEVQSSDHVQEYLHEAMENRIKPALMRFPVSERQCAAMKCHLETFKANPILKYNGFVSDPMTYEGASCTPFAASFLERIGYLDPYFKESWIREITISEKLIGNGYRGQEIAPNQDGKRRRISILSILNPFKKSRWTYDGYPNRVISYYDPQMTYDFILQVRACASDPQSKECSDPRIARWAASAQAKAFEGFAGIPGVELSRSPHFEQSQIDAIQCEQDHVTDLDTVLQGQQLPPFYHRMPGLYGLAVHPESVESGLDESPVPALPSNAENLKSWISNLDRPTWLRVVKQVKQDSIEAIEASSLAEARLIARQAGKVFFRLRDDEKVYASLFHEEVLQIFRKEKPNPAY